MVEGRPEAPTYGIKQTKLTNKTGITFNRTYSEKLLIDWDESSNTKIDLAFDIIEIETPDSMDCKFFISK